ncbi:MAG: hypothetical protein JST92_09905 [Deltaproteobacteria bacterium]|nr:hypothetical protein [Deltaproteobacteria bacterium]
MSQTPKVRILLFKDTTPEGAIWVAQMIEYDLAAQGPDVKTALKQLANAIKAQAATDLSLGREPFEGVEPAPPEVMAQYQAAYPTGNSLDVDVPRTSKTGKAKKPASARTATRTRIHVDEIRVG